MPREKVPPVSGAFHSFKFAEAELLELVSWFLGAMVRTAVPPAGDWLPMESTFESASLGLRVVLIDGPATPLTHETLSSWAIFIGKAPRERPPSLAANETWELAVEPDLPSLAPESGGPAVSVQMSESSVAEINEDATLPSVLIESLLSLPRLRSEDPVETGAPFVTPATFTPPVSIEGPAPEVLGLKSIRRAGARAAEILAEPKSDLSREDISSSGLGVKMSAEFDFRAGCHSWPRRGGVPLTVLSGSRVRSSAALEGDEQVPQLHPELSVFWGYVE